MKRILLFSFLLALSLVAIPVVFAGSASFSGTFTPDDSPTMPVVAIAGNACVAQGTTPVAYDLVPFTVDQSGTYTFQLSMTVPVGGLISLYLMDAGFNPAGAFPNCIAASNAGPSPISFNASLTAGALYYAIPFDDTFSQSGGSYTATISGPGNVTLGGTVACPYPLPVNSVVYQIPAGAPAFFAPNLESQVNFNLPAGSWYISEFSGDFAKVWVACQASPVWVPANAVAR